MIQAEASFLLDEPNCSSQEAHCASLPEAASKSTQNTSYTFADDTVQQVSS